MRPPSSAGCPWQCLLRSLRWTVAQCNTLCCYTCSMTYGSQRISYTDVPVCLSTAKNMEWRRLHTRWYNSHGCGAAAPRTPRHTPCAIRHALYAIRCTLCFVRYTLYAIHYTLSVGFSTYNLPCTIYHTLYTIQTPSKITPHSKNIVYNCVPDRTAHSLDHG